MHIALTPIHAVVVALSEGALPQFTPEGQGWREKDFVSELRKIERWHPDAKEAWYRLFATKVVDFSKGYVWFEFLTREHARALGIPITRKRGAFFILRTNVMNKYGFIGPYSDPVQYIETVKFVAKNHPSVR